MALRFWNLGKKKQETNKKEIKQMASFQIFQATLKTIEGGYQAIVADNGNYNSLGQLIGTNHGISAIALEEYLGRVPSVSDMKNLSYSTALIIFKNAPAIESSLSLIQLTPITPIDPLFIFTYSTTEALEFVA